MVFGKNNNITTLLVLTGKIIKTIKKIVIILINKLVLISNIIFLYKFIYIYIYYFVGVTSEEALLNQDKIIPDYYIAGLNSFNQIQ